MQQMVFAPFRIRVPQEYLVGEESVGLKAFRRLLPPFIHVEVIEQNSPDYDDLKVHSVTFEAGENFATNVDAYTSRLIEDQMGQSTREFSTSIIADSIKPDSNGRRLGIPLLKAIIAEMAELEESHYIEGVTKAYVIHPPQFEDELRRLLSALPLPSISSPASERLLSVAIADKVRHFIVEPYNMDLPRRRSTDPNWLIVHLYNPDMPALGVKVETQGPLTFREPTPLLSKTEVAEKWAMGLLQHYFRETGIRVQHCVYEPNGPKTFPDYRARLNDVPWDFEVTRVLGDILENRRIFDQPKDAKKNIDMVVQSPPIGERDVGTALAHAINSKKGKRQPDGTTRNLFLVLLNVLDLNIRGNANVWDDVDLTAFNAVVLVSGYPRPSVELIKWPF